MPSGKLLITNVVAVHIEHWCNPVSTERNWQHSVLGAVGYENPWTSDDWFLWIGESR